MRGGRNMAMTGEMTQKCGHFFRPHLPWMAFAVKEDEAFDPAEVGPLGQQAIVLKSQQRADFIKQFSFCADSVLILEPPII